MRTRPLIGLVAAVLAVTVPAGYWLGGRRAAVEPVLKGKHDNLKTSQRVFVPADVGAPPWLAARGRAQVEAGKRERVSHDFGFADRRGGSGIGFRHKFVDDCGRNHIAVHYDHGNGLAVADVDGDGRTDVYFVNQAGPNALYRNLGGGKFADITREAGVAAGDGVSVGASFADVDNDGDPDLYVTRVRAGNLLYRNDGGKFVDISKQAGVGHRGHSSAAVFFDYDRDGLLDLFVVNVGTYTTDALATNGDGFRYYAGFPDAFAGHLHPERSERSVLFRNLGGNRFADVSERTGLVHSAWSGDATAFDADGDGFPGLYVLNMQGDDHYYENVGGSKFVERTREVFPKTPWGSMGVKAFDADNDGRFDLFVTDMHSDMSEDVGPEREGEKSAMRWAESYLKTEGRSLFGNAFYRNAGGGRFEEASDELGLETYWPWGVSAGDLNADGFEDVFITSSMNYPFRYAVNRVLLNDRGVRFVAAEFLLGVEPRAGGVTATPWFARDCETASPTEPPPECVGRDGPVSVWGALGSRSSAVFDLDNDGDLDVVTNDFGSAPMVLVSDLAARRPSLRFLKVRLIGTASNRDGLGAVVSVVAGPNTYRRVHDGKSGYLSQSATPLYFGLGDAKAVDRVEVKWTSGRTQVVAGPVAVNRLVDVREE